MNPSSSNRKFWDRFAGLYSPFMNKNQSLYRAICQCLSPRLQPSMDVLELACGTGQLTLPLAPLVRSWAATDFSPAMVKHARARVHLPNVTLSIQDASCLPYPDHSFHCVVIANALHIMPMPEAALAEIRRVLMPGGLLLAPTFVYEDGVRSLRLRLLELLGFRTFHRWDSEHLARFVADCGFAVESRELLSGGPLPECCLIAAAPPCSGSEQGDRR